MGLIRRCDLCGSDWKAKIRELWEKYQGCVRGVKAGSITSYPDGDGIADIDGAVTDAITQQMPTMLDGYVTDSELADTLENYPTDGDLAQTLEDYATTNQLYAKQDRLITGINLKTVGGQSLIDSAGDIPVVSPSVLDAIITELRQEIAEASKIKTSKINAEIYDETTNPKHYIVAKVPLSGVSGYRDIGLQYALAGANQIYYYSMGISRWRLSASGTGTFKWGLATKGDDLNTAYIIIKNTTTINRITNTMLRAAQIRPFTSGGTNIDIYDEIELYDDLVMDDSYTIQYEQT